ncbi:hypothetical protein [Streptomyces sp. S465]
MHPPRGGRQGGKLAALVRHGCPLAEERYRQYLDHKEKATE